MKTKYVLLLPTTLILQKSVIFDWNGIRLLGMSPQCYVMRILPVLFPLCLAVSKNNNHRRREASEFWRHLLRCPSRVLWTWTLMPSIQCVLTLGTLGGEMSLRISKFLSRKFATIHWSFIAGENSTWTGQSEIFVCVKG